MHQWDALLAETTSSLVLLCPVFDSMAYNAEQVAFGVLGLADQLLQLASLVAEGDAAVAGRRGRATCDQEGLDIAGQQALLTIQVTHMPGALAFIIMWERHVSCEEQNSVGVLH